MERLMVTKTSKNINNIIEKQTIKSNNKTRDNNTAFVKTPSQNEQINAWFQGILGMGG